MSTEKADAAPVIVHPGGDGWAQEPNVTLAERLLYGDRAAIVRLLGQAAVAASDAYSLACKRDAQAVPLPVSVTDPETGEKGPVPQALRDEEIARRQVIEIAWQLAEQAEAAAAGVAERALVQRRALVTASR